MLLHDVVRMNAFRTPSSVAVSDERRTYTFADLEARMHRVANAMRARTGDGARIAVLSKNSCEYVECYYGISAAGMVLTHLNYRLSPVEWAWILNDAGAVGVVVGAEFSGPLLDVVDDVPSLRFVVVVDDEPSARSNHGSVEVVDYEALLAAAHDDAPESRHDDSADCWLLYTSGTTGRPKGAVLTHRSLTTAVVQQVVEYAPTPSERALVAFPLCHVGGNSVPTYHLRGGAVVIIPAYEPELWLATIERFAITVSGMAPTMFAGLLAHPRLERYDLSSLDGLGYGGGPMPPDLVREGIARFGPIFYSGFGMTELGGHATNLSKEEHRRAVEGAERDEHLLTSCGRPMCMAMTRVVRPDGADCATGEVGEIVVQGEQVFDRYLNHDDATTAAFEGGWFHTGDLARRDDAGYLYLVDRLKDMIITGGENVYSVEVEQVLSAHPDLAEVAVIGLPHEYWGEQVTAVVVPRADRPPSADDLVAFARASLGGYKVPKRVVFVEALPKNVSGKVLKAQLREELGDTR
jgi:long-chain acyl-CoA synthetase